MKNSATAIPIKATTIPLLLPSELPAVLEPPELSFVVVTVPLVSLTPALVADAAGVGEGATVASAVGLGVGEGWVVGDGEGVCVGVTGAAVMARCLTPVV